MRVSGLTIATVLIGLSMILPWGMYGRAAFFPWGIAVPITYPTDTGEMLSFTIVWHHGYYLRFLLLPLIALGLVIVGFVNGYIVLAGGVMSLFSVVYFWNELCRVRAITEMTIYAFGCVPMIIGGIIATSIGLNRVYVLFYESPTAGTKEERRERLQQISANIKILERELAECNKERDDLSIAWGRMPEKTYHKRAGIIRRKIDKLSRELDKLEEKKSMLELHLATEAHRG